jgi:hypothetical protein
MYNLMARDQIAIYVLVHENQRTARTTTSGEAEPSRDVIEVGLEPAEHGRAQQRAVRAVRLPHAHETGRPVLRPQLLWVNDTSSGEVSRETVERCKDSLLALREARKHGSNAVRNRLHEGQMRAATPIAEQRLQLYRYRRSEILLYLNEIHLRLLL